MDGEKKQIATNASAEGSATAAPEAPVRTGRLAGSGLRVARVGPKPASTSARRPRRANAVPDDLLQDAALNADIALLPSNYSFEVHKTVWRVRNAGARRVALQLPEGLLRFASVLSDILRRHAGGARTVVLGDVTYGACCVDDFSAAALGCDFLVHYGHSCLVPVKTCKIPMLYVFVHIKFEPEHLVRCLKDNFPAEKRIALIGTIQFIDTVHAIRPELDSHFAYVSVPQAKPLSPAEVLGCTAPKMPDVDTLVYVGDGRFHLESAMIANPSLPAYRYDPYSKTFTVEEYGHKQMRSMRRAAVEQAKEARSFGIILGTLGRQGSPAILERLQAAARKAGKSSVVVLLSEIQPSKIEVLEKSGIQAWVQIACPRLSIDWGTCYGKCPLLNPYEAFVAFGAVEWREKEYPMDFYAKGSGPWTNYHKPDRPVAKSADGAKCACAK